MNKVSTLSSLERAVLVLAQQAAHQRLRQVERQMNNLRQMRRLVLQVPDGMAQIDRQDLERHAEELERMLAPAAFAWHEIEGHCKERLK